MLLRWLQLQWTEERLADDTAALTAAAWMHRAHRQLAFEWTKHRSSSATVAVPSVVAAHARGETVLACALAPLLVHHTASEPSSSRSLERQSEWELQLRVQVRADHDAVADTADRDGWPPLEEAMTAEVAASVAAAFALDATVVAAVDVAVVAGRRQAQA